MLPGNLCRFRLGPYAIVTLALACAAMPASAWAAANRPRHGDLSPRLAELTKPSVRSAPPTRQAKDLSLAPKGPGSLLRQGNRVLVEVRFGRGAAAGVDDLRAAGAKIVNVSPRYQTVTVAAKPSELRQLAGVPGIRGASPVLTPSAWESTCPSGNAVSEGDVQLRAAEARAAKVGIDGGGVTVGILSDSFDQAEEAADESGPIATHQAEDVESGDLPGAANTCPGQATPVNVLDDSETEGEDEGRAMGQIVHDLAPGAQLAFATAFTSEIGFAENIEELAKPLGEGGAGAQVIVDDVSYFGEPFFQEGPVGTAVSKVTAGGVSYFSSAGNNNLIDGGREIGSWEAPEFRDTSCPAGLPPFATECMDFAPGAAADPTFGIRVSPDDTLRVDLQWAQPWNGVTTDLDAYLLNGSDEVVAKSEEFNVAETQQPFEFIPWTNTASVSQTVRLAINRCGPSCDNVTGGDTESPRLKFALLQNGGGVTATEYESSRGGDIVGPTIFGHNGGEDVTSVAAIPFNTTESPEPYSSRGPVTHHFGPVNGVTAAEPLVPAEVLSKPDVTASDCNVTTFFAFKAGPNWRFCGTSAAAPHTAAVAALMLQEEPAATPRQIRQALQEGASPIGASGPCAIGAGLVDAVEAIAALLAPDSGSPPACTPPESEPVDEGEPESPREEKNVVVNPPQVQPPQEGPGPEPQTRFVRHPAKLVRTATGAATAVFRFGASEGGVTFFCRVDKGPFHRCEPRLVRRFVLGAHVVRVFARAASGVADPTPAVFRFRVAPLE